MDVAEARGRPCAADDLCDRWLAQVREGSPDRASATIVPVGTGDHQVVAAAAVLILTAAMLARGRRPRRVVGSVDRGGW
jgi:hypothetical protein